MNNPISKQIYIGYIERIEKWCQNLTFAIMKVTLQCMMWPLFITSFVTYWTTNNGSDAFQLPFYAW